MSWFKRDSPLRTSLRKKPSISATHQLDASACFEAFKMHWQQASIIMEKQSLFHPGQHPMSTVDDVTSVINHFDQMMTLLLQETTKVASPQSPVEDTSPFLTETSGTGPILDCFLHENVLERLFVWGSKSGEFVNLLKLEQLKIYELLVSQSTCDFLLYKPVLHPMLQLLAACSECSPFEVEKRLVVLLNTLCVCITQNPDVLAIFFTNGSKQGPSKFLIFSLLIPFVHREGAIGQQARDALLLCMSLSRTNDSIGAYIAEHSNFCPVLATGLSGLYSVLPRKLPIVSEDWHRFTPEDIQEMPELAVFLNSLEFCNAVIQIAHPMVKDQLLEYLYQGFLVPVLGPALHQNTLEEIVATTAYLELFLRTVTEPSLLQVFLKFILTSTFEGQRILDTLIQRIGAQSMLCVVTIVLFCTLLDLNCEDVMIELALKYLIPCTHVMVSQRSRVRDLDLYSGTAEKLLSLSPASCAPDISSDSIAGVPDFSLTTAHQKGFHPSPVDRLTLGGSLRLKRHTRTLSTSSFSYGDYESLSARQHMANGPSLPFHHNHYSRSESFQTRYIDYMQDAHRAVKANLLACSCWSAAYNGIDPPPGNTNVPPKTNNSVGDLKVNMKPQRPNMLRLKIPTSDGTRSVNSRHLKKDTERSNGTGDSINLTTAVNGVETLPVSKLNHDKCSLEETRNTLLTKSDRTLNSKDSEPLPSSTPVPKGCTEIKDNDKLIEVSLANGIDSASNSDEEDQAFWSIINSVKTPSSISDAEESFRIISAIQDAGTKNGCGQTSHDSLQASEISCTKQCVVPPLGSDLFANQESSHSSDGSSFPGEHGQPSNVSANKEVTSCEEEASTHPCSPSDSSLYAFVHRGITNPIGRLSHHSSPITWESFGCPDIGPFLSHLLTRLEMMLQNDVYTNLQLTGLIARLALYPQPLLHSFLLNHTLVFQPSVRSLLQVLGSLKHKVDSFANTIENIDVLLWKARQFLMAREERAVTDGPPRTYRENSSRQNSTSPEMHRAEPRRRSLTHMLFRRGSILLGERDRSQTFKEPTLQSIPDGQGYRYINKVSTDMPDGQLESVKLKNAVLCIVILEEFLKELAAISQEYAVIHTDPEFWLQSCSFQ